MQSAMLRSSVSLNRGAQSRVAEFSGDGFRVDLDAYSGPFDALLGLIANRRLELTEIALSSVTEEFLAYMRTLGDDADMDRISAFVDVASILVEAKSAALLPHDEADEVDAQGMEALRERDLLFARLLQYRAFRQAADEVRAMLAANSGWFAHPACLDLTAQAKRAQVVWTIDPAQLARLAAHALVHAPTREVCVHQLHVPLVDVHEQYRLVQRRLRALADGQSMTFAQLSRGVERSIEVVARFLAVLALFKQGAVQVRQDEPFAELYVRWVAGADAEDPRDVNEGHVS